MTATPTPAASTATVLARFNRAFVDHDPDLLDALIAPDCRVERSQPTPEGTHLVGRAACLANWRALASNRQGTFTIEDVQVMGETGLVFWHYRFGPEPAQAQRGLNVMVVRDGLVVGGRGYTKAAS
jgi:hypothetical protein